ncbi:MAG: hypothetical protein AAF211_09010 [Myxococcota bacterium]
MREALIGMVLLAGCGKKAVPLPAPSAEPAFPTGWWQTKAYAVRFDPGGYVLVGTDDSADRRTCTWEWRSTHWSCPERPDDLLFWSNERVAYGIASDVQRFEVIADPTPFDRSVADLEDPALVCPAAAACCLAVPGLGLDCEGLSRGTSLYVCAYGLEYIRTQVGAEAPAACQ